MYEKQNFENGKTLTAEQLNHMEDGIANVLPANPDSEPFKHLVVDGHGKVKWEERTHYSFVEAEFERPSDDSIASICDVKYEEWGEEEGEAVLYKTYYKIGERPFEFPEVSEETIDEMAEDFAKRFKVYDSDGKELTSLATIGTSLLSDNALEYGFDNNGVLAEFSFVNSECEVPSFITSSEKVVHPGVYVKANSMFQSGLKIVFGSLKTLDPKFIPPIESNVFIVHYHTDFMSVDESWSDIVAAYNKGAALFLQTDRGESDMLQVALLRPLNNIDPSDEGFVTFAGLAYGGTEFVDEALRANFITVDYTGNVTFKNYVISTES